MSGRATAEALPRRLQWSSQARHAGRRQREADWRIYRDFAQSLIQIARPLYVHSDLGLELEGTAYAFDATTINLSLALSLGPIQTAQSGDQDTRCWRFTAQFPSLLGLKQDLYTSLQIFSLTLFEKTPILGLLQQSQFNLETLDDRNQLQRLDS